MENNVKKEWQQPLVEALDVSETMLGIGTHKIDSVYVNGKIVDMDIYDS
jgi:ubiquinone/menaquinone biosynthesis C-methylase UbiE